MEININKDLSFFFSKGVEALSRDPITLDLRQYNPLTAHLLTQSYVYPKSNGLTQTDRGNFFKSSRQKAFQPFPFPTFF